MSGFNGQSHHYCSHYIFSFSRVESSQFIPNTAYRLSNQGKQTSIILIIEQIIDTDNDSEVWNQAFSDQTNVTYVLLLL